MVNSDQLGETPNFWRRLLFQRATGAPLRLPIAKMTELSPLNSITLNAFITALAELDAPLPDITRDGVRHLGRIYPDRVAELHELALNYPPLANRYLEAREAWQNPSGDRRESTESDNTEKQNILTASDPVAAARKHKQARKGTFWQRLLSFFQTAIAICFQTRAGDRN